MTTFIDWLRGVKFELIALGSTLLVIGSFFSFAIPIGYGNDESVHAYKGYALSRGQLTLYKIGPWTTADNYDINVYGGLIPSPLYDLEQTANSLRTHSKCTQFECQKPNTNQAEQLQHDSAQPLDGKSLKPTDFWGANSYSFIGYIPSAIGFGLSSIFNLSAGSSVHIARLANLLICTLMTLAAFWILRDHRARWLIFAAALLPPSIVSFASLGVDGSLIALSLLLFASIIRIHTDQRASRLIATIAITSAILLPLIKLPYAILSLLLFTVPLFSPKRRRLWARIGLASIILIPALLWNVAAGDAMRTQAITVHAGTTPPNTAQQISHSLRHPIGTVKIALSSIISSSPISDAGKITQQPGLTVPGDLMIVSFSTILLSALYATRASRGRRRRSAIKLGLSLLIACIVVTGGIIASMYFTYNSVGATTIAGVQGRYFLPLYSFAIFSIALLANLSISQPTRIAKYIFIATPVIINIITAIWYLGIVY